MELSVLTYESRLPSPTLVPAAVYQKVKEGEQPVAFKEKGRSTQDLTSLTAWLGAAGSEVTVRETSLDARTQVPAGSLAKLAKAFSLAPFNVGAAITESTTRPLTVQEKEDESGTSAFSQTVKPAMNGAFRRTTRTESE